MWGFGDKDFMKGGEEVSVSCRTAPVDGSSSEGTTDKGICAASCRQRPLPAPVGSGTPPRLAGHPHFPPGLCVLGAMLTQNIPEHEMSVNAAGVAPNKAIQTCPEPCGVQAGGECTSHLFP